MNYLNAAIAFAVLMAVLAGLVTTVMQGIWRVLRVKQGNLIKVLKQLDADVMKTSSLNLNAAQRWDAIVSILNNPTSARATLPTAEELKIDGRLPRRWRPWNSRMRAGDCGTHPIETAITNLDRVHAHSSQYEKVTAEHVARRVAEVAGHGKTTVSNERLSEQLNKIVRKFEEYASAMSTEFTRRSFYWSISVGILLVLVFNINGLVAFNAFLADPDLADQISISTNTSPAQASNTQDSALQALDAELRALSGKGVPIGPTQWPHCYVTASADCKPPVEFQRGAQPSPEKIDWWTILLLWFPSAIVTGVFLGLGAPFWFDVAKRLSAVRSMFGGSGKTADRLSGKSAEGNPNTRAKIVASVVTDELGGETMIKRHTFNEVVDLSKLTVSVNDNSANTHFLLTLIGGDQSHNEWSNDEVRRGVAHPLQTAAGFYRAELEVIFRGNDIASIEIAVPGSASDPFKFQLTGEKGQLCRAICPIFMA